MVDNLMAGFNDASSMEKSMPNAVLLSWPIHQNPVLKPSKPNLASPNMIMREIQTSFKSKVEKCSKFLLHLLAYQNPFLKNLLSFSFNFYHHLAQMRYSNNRNVSFMSHNHNFAAVLPGDSVAGIVVANGILNFLNIYNSLLIVRLVLTWFPNSPPAIVSPLSTLCDPYLNIFRGIIPPLGGTLDLSPILAFLVLNAFTSTAAALPAELPGTKTAQGSCVFTNLTASQKKWMRRVCGNKGKNSPCCDD